MALVRYGGLEMRTDPGQLIARFDVDDDFAFGATVGIGVPLGGRRRWSTHANLTYLDTALRSTSQVGRIRSDYDATIYALGFGYRF